MGFDRTAWAAGRGNATGENPRGGMVAAARAAGVDVGAARAVVRDLLGEPDGSDAAADVWFLGRAEYAVDFRTLRVGYDAAGIVTAVDERST